MAKVRINDQVVIESRGIKSITPNQRGDTVITYLNGESTVIPVTIASQEQVLNKLDKPGLRKRPRR